MRVIGYARVSTEEQGLSGLGLEAQTAQLRATCKARGWQLVQVETDIASGRKRTKRPGLERALETCRAGEADAILAAKLDRVSRSVVDFYNLVREAERGNFAIAIADGSFDLTTAAGRAMAGMLAVFAQFESEVTGERTSRALQARKARGLPVGGPRHVTDATLAVVRDTYAACGSLRATAKRLQEQGVPSGRGGVWHAQTVSRLLTRAS